jgi:hypothetical protein
MSDLENSGVSEATAIEAGLHSVDSEKLNGKLGFNLPKDRTGLVFPYDEKFYRVRIYPPLPEMKYVQPKGSGTCLYVLKHIKDSLKNQTIPLYIAEGEKKALKACQEGLHCLGIGGPWNWLKNGKPIEDLNKVAWVARPVFLVPDSDVWSRPNLIRPVYALGKELADRGADVSVLVIPQESEEKLGFDDFLVARGRDELNTLSSVPLKHGCFTEAKAWHKGWLEKRDAAKPEKETRCSARFPGLLDLIYEDGRVRFLITTNDGIQVVDRWQAEDGSVLIPPPPEAIPYEIIPADLTIAYLQDNDGDLYHSILALLRKVSKLPSDEHYHLCTIYTFFTYKSDAAPYFPYLWFLGLPERGKSRIAKALTKLGWRGLYTETLNDAYIFRFADLFGGILGLDVYELVKKAQKRGSHDLLLGRFEQGVKVARVIAPDKGPFRDTLYFEVSGPTILATNEEIAAEDPLRSRCIKIAMPEARGIYPNISDDDLKVLRARLLAWRARHLEVPLPDVEKPVAGRLGDLMQPLFAIAELLPREAKESLRTLTQDLEEERRDSEAETLAGRIVEAFHTLQEEVAEGRLAVDRIREKVNEGVEEKWHISPQRIGRELSALGIDRKKSQGRMHAVLTPGGLKRLFQRFSLVTEDPEGKTSPSSPFSLTRTVESKNKGEIVLETSPISLEDHETPRETREILEKTPSPKLAPDMEKGDKGNKGDCPLPGDCANCPAQDYWEGHGPEPFCFYEAYFIGKAAPAQLAEERSKDCPLEKQ